MKKTVITTFATENKVAVYALKVALYQIAKQKKVQLIGEELLMFVMKEVIKIMIGEKESKKLDSVSLSNNTTKTKLIVEMPYNVLKQMLNEAKKFIHVFNSIG